MSHEDVLILSFLFCSCILLCSLLVLFFLFFLCVYVGPLILAEGVGRKSIEID